MAGLCFVVTGTGLTGANGLFRKALPTLKKFGAPVDGLNTVAALPEANVINGNGEPTADSAVTFYFPSFDAIRENPEKVRQLAVDLQAVLGVPAHTINAAVVAGFIEK